VEVAKRAGLNDQHRLFVREYLRDRNQTRAARRAGYSPHSAAETASRLLHDPRYAHVQEALRRALEDERRKWEHLQERIIQERCRIAFADLTDVMDADGNLLPLADIHEDARAAIAELKETEFLGQDGQPSTSRKVRFWSKNEALTALEKISGLVKDRVEHSGHVDVRAARADLADILSRMGPPEGEPGGEGSAEPGLEGAAPPQPD
jgi:phage terminase small subunit